MPVKTFFNRIYNQARNNLYLSKRLDVLNDEINAVLINIENCKEIINSSEDKELVDEAYTKANSCIKSLITYQIEVDSLLKNSELHSYESKLRPLKSKLNYVGGRFATAKDYDSSLWSRVSGLSQKIEYSLDPVEVVNSYFERENIYKERNRHKDYVPKSGSENEIQLKKIDTTSSNSNESKFSEEIKNTIEDLRAMRAQLTDDDVKEIESLLRR